LEGLGSVSRVDYFIAVFGKHLAEQGSDLSVVVND
jgi:hypothetical protein